MIKAYLNFLWKSKNAHAIHSPFVFELYTKIINNKEQVSVFQDIEKFRNEQINNHTKIDVTDFGAGSKIHKGNIRSISQIAKSAEKKPKYGQLLFRLVRYFQPNTILDLGTSLGITTLYLSKAINSHGKIVTFEGCPATSFEAKKLFEKANANNIEVIEGDLDFSLSNKMNDINSVDFAFFDANHQYKPTINYFENALKKAHNLSVFIFDDIHWSAEMEEAWQYIKNHDKVLITIDLFDLGLVFFRTNQPKQHFVLRF